MALQVLMGSMCMMCSSVFAQDAGPGAAYTFAMVDNFESPLAKLSQPQHGGLHFTCLQ